MGDLAPGKRLGAVHPAGSAICSPFIIDYNYGGSVGTSLEDATFRAAYDR
jgi:hypothetical protein